VVVFLLSDYWRTFSSTSSCNFREVAWEEEEEEEEKKKKGKSGFRF